MEMARAWGSSASISSPRDLGALVLDIWRSPVSGALSALALLSFLGQHLPWSAFGRLTFSGFDTATAWLFAPVIKWAPEYNIAGHNRASAVFLILMLFQSSVVLYTDHFVDLYERRSYHNPFFFGYFSFQLIVIAIIFFAMPLFFVLFYDYVMHEVLRKNIPALAFSVYIVLSLAMSTFLVIVHPTARHLLAQRVYWLCVFLVGFVVAGTFLSFFIEKWLWRWL